MTKYKVLASYRTYVYAIVEAENKDQAYEIARELDGGAFELVDNDGLSDWRIYDVSEDEA